MNLPAAELRKVRDGFVQEVRPSAAFTRNELAPTASHCLKTMKYL